MNGVSFTILHELIQELIAICVLKEVWDEKDSTENSDQRGKYRSHRDAKGLGKGGENPAFGLV